VSVPGAVVDRLSDLLETSTIHDDEQRRLVSDLYREHWKGICGYIRTHFGAGPPEPEDVAQTAFVRFVTTDSRGIENPQAFLYATARNLVIDHHRHAKRERAFIRTQSAVNSEEMPSELAPENVLVQAERFRILAEALERVPLAHRRMVLLNRFEGLNYVEIGHRFGMSPETVRKRIERTLAACLKALDAAQSCEQPAEKRS
jgi:RNA polymerase sigma-70 factor (ECF subfamily)